MTMKGEGQDDLRCFDLRSFRICCFKGGDKVRLNDKFPLSYFMMPRVTRCLHDYRSNEPKYWPHGGSFPLRFASGGLLPTWFPPYIPWPRVVTQELIWWPKFPSR